MNKLIDTLLAVALTALAIVPAMGQRLKPGFDIEEYRECLRITSNMRNMLIDSVYKCEKPKHSRRLFDSGNVGFDNAWELWQDNRDGVVTISMRATVSTMLSWTSNFNAGMVPAKGTIKFQKEREYCLSTDSTALVHAGWTAGLSTMTESIEQRIDSCYKKGVRDFRVTGHSQGGALACLVTAHLRVRQINGAIPKDVTFKTYCSAAPKPGDYAFAMTYEHMTRGGWSYTVVNYEDWVPETPLSIEQPTDMRPTNPFAQLEDLLKDVGPMTRLKMKFLYKRISKPAQEEVENIQKYLGVTVGGMMEQSRPEYSQPVYTNSSNFARCGQNVILMPDAEYYKSHPKKSKDAFEHHMYKAYYELAERYE